MSESVAKAPRAGVSREKKRRISTVLFRRSGTIRAFATDSDKWRRWPPGARPPAAQQPRDRSWSSWSGAGRTRPARERPSGKTPTGNPALAGDRPHRIDLSPRTTVLGEDASQRTVTAEMAFWEDRSPRFVGGARRFPHNSAACSSRPPRAERNDPPRTPKSGSGEQNPVHPRRLARCCAQGPDPVRRPRSGPPGARPGGPPGSSAVDPADLPGGPGPAGRSRRGSAAQRTLLMVRIEKQPTTAQPMETGKTSV